MKVDEAAIEHVCTAMSGREGMQVMGSCIINGYRKASTFTIVFDNIIQ